MMKSSNAEYSSMGVSNLIGIDGFAEILSLLPDDFFNPEVDRDSYWRQVYYAAAHGERDVTRLAEIYQHSYNPIKE